MVKLTHLRTEDSVLEDQASLYGQLRRINSLAYAASMDELINQAFDFLLDITQADSATYFQFDAEKQEMEVVAVRNGEQSQHLIGLRLPRVEFLLQAAPAEEQPIIIGNLTDDPGWLRIASPFSAARMVNLLSLPLVAHNRLIGVVQLYNFKQTDLNLLELMRERVAIEIERKIELEKSQRTTQRLFELVESAGLFGTTLDRKQLLSTLLEKTASIMDAERASIFLTDPRTNEMVFQIAFQTPEETPLPKQRLKGNTAPLASVQPTQNRDAFSLFSQSAITVPIQAVTMDGQQGDKTRHIGGLMALNPNGREFNHEDMRILQILAQQTSAILQMAEIFESTEELFLDTISTMVTALDAKDTYTQGHSQRVSEYSVLIAQELGLSASQVYDIRMGSLLHDFGKIGIPDAILRKNGPLDSDEWSMVQSHPLLGWNILRQVKLLEPALPAILEHHEKLDGTGYPHALCGEKISLMGRIVAVADVFDAMTSDRPYRKALQVAEVIDYMLANSDIIFDRRCVNALVQILGRNLNPEAS